MDARRICELLEIDKLYNQHKDGIKLSGINALLGEVVKSDLKQFFAGQIWACAIDQDGEDYIMLAKTALPEKEFDRLFAAAQNSDNKDLELKLKKTVLQGHTVYVIARNESKQQDDDEEEAAALIYLAEDVVLLAELEDVSGQMLSAVKQGGSNKLLAAIDRTALCAMMLEANQADDNKLRGIAGKLDVAGTGQAKSIALDLQLSFAEKKIAKQTAMQIQLLGPGVIGLAFGNDENLAMTLATALKVKASDKNVNILWQVPFNTLKAAVAYLLDPRNKVNLGGNEAIGPGQKQNKTTSGSQTE